MISEIITAINTKLKTVFPDVPRETTDIKEGFNRPSFFVEYECNSSAIGESLVQNNIDIKIYYFSSNKNKSRIECIETIEKLNNAFRLVLSISESCAIPIDETSSTILEDGILIFSFDLVYVNEIAEEAPGELINDLEINIMKG